MNHPFSRLLIVGAFTLSTLVGGYAAWLTVRAASGKARSRTPDFASFASLPSAQRQHAQAVRPVLALDEIFVSISEGKDKAHSLELKLELELFDESGKAVLVNGASGIRNTVIKAAREQKSPFLKTISGKLAFKEMLVSRINHFLNRVVVRDVRFASFDIR